MRRPINRPRSAVQTVAATRRMLARADAAAATPDDTVTSKLIVPISGTKRSFVALDTYAWPSNGNATDVETPWELRDGYPNPDVRPAL